MKINHVTQDLEGVLASTRYRAIIPGAEFARAGHEVLLDTRPDFTATVNVWHKFGTEEDILAIAEHGGIFDVTDYHYDNAELGDWYREMTRAATVVTASSPKLAKYIAETQGREVVPILDPWEFAERPFEWRGGQRVLWFGTLPNFDTLRGVELDCPLTIVTAAPEPKGKVNVKLLPYSRDVMLQAFADNDIVILPQNTESRKKWVNSNNRAIQALRQGKFVVASDIYHYRELEDYIYIADTMLEGIRWARKHPDSARAMVEAGQAFIRDRYSPATVAAQWEAVFARFH